MVLPELSAAAVQRNNTWCYIAAFPTTPNKQVREPKKRSSIIKFATSTCLRVSASLGPTECPFLLIVQLSAETSAPRRDPTKPKYWSLQKRSYLANLQLETVDAWLTSLMQPCSSYSDFACPTAIVGLIPRIFYVNRFIGSLRYVVSSLVRYIEQDSTAIRYKRVATVRHFRATAHSTQVAVYGLICYRYTGRDTT